MILLAQVALTGTIGLVHLAARLRWFVESNTASLTCLDGNSCETGLSWPLSPYWNLRALCVVSRAVHETRSGSCQFLKVWAKNWDRATFILFLGSELSQSHLRFEGRGVDPISP